jgi:TPR repeat protein
LLCYDNGWGIDKDTNKTINLYKKACDAGLATGCYNLAVKYKNGIVVKKKDELTAIELYQKACDLNFAITC